MARIRGIADTQIVAALSAEQSRKDQEGRYASFLSSRQVGAIVRVRLYHQHIQIKVTLISNPGSEFPAEPEVWLSIRQLDDDLQQRVRDHLRHTGASEMITAMDKEKSA